MAFIPVKTPWLFKRIFPNYTWGIHTSKNVLYLTFDDGPNPNITPWTLNVLEHYNAKATFFCIGNNIQKYPNIFKNIIRRGHAVGNHTQHHVNGWKAKTKAYLKDVEKAQDIIQSTIQNSEFRIQNLFRPPYGKLKPKQGKALLKEAYNIVMWDVLSFDWDKGTSKEKCYNNVVSKAKPGSIIVFHDSEKAAKNMQYVLPKVLDHFTAKGYSFEALTL